MLSKLVIIFRNTYSNYFNSNLLENHNFIFIYDTYALMVFKKKNTVNFQIFKNNRFSIEKLYLMLSSFVRIEQKIFTI